MLIKQTSKNFSDYTKLLVQFDQKSKDTPDYLYFNIRERASTSTNPEGYLIFYGIKGLVDSVPPEIYDSALESSMFEFDNGKMKMNMDLDMNGNSVINTSFPFLMTAKYNKNVSVNRALFNAVVASTLPYDGSLNEILVDLRPNVQNDYQIIILVTVNVGNNVIGFNYRSKTNSPRQREIYPSFRLLPKYSKIIVGIWNKVGFISPSAKNKPITSDFANICLK